MMRALVVYESMFGNTRSIAEAIAAGLRSIYQVELMAVGDVAPADLRAVDLVVAGGPTHVHGMSRPTTRAGALRQAEVPGSGLRLEPGATGSGLRELLETAGGLSADAAAFDTRVATSPLLSGRASRSIARALSRAGCRVVAPPESFLVAKRGAVLLPGEEARARGWGSELAALGMVSLGADHR